MTQPTHARSFVGRVAACLAILLAGAALAILPATPAQADCPINDPDCGVPPEHTYSSTLTVNTQNVGTVTSSPAGIACPGDCTETDEVTIPGTIRPTIGWTTYTLTAAGGPAGTTPYWAGCDSVDASHRCVVANDDLDTDVAVGWFDETSPTVGSLSPADGATVGRTVVAQATASDGAGIREVRFEVDNVTKVTDTSAPYTASLDLSGLPSGTTHYITAQAFDNNGLTSQVNHLVTVDTSTQVSLGNLPDLLSTHDPLAVAVTTDPDATTTCTTIDTATHAPVPGATLSDPCTGSYTIPFTPETPDGTYQVRAAATDAVGNSAVAARDVVVDNTAPSLDVAGVPADGGTVHGPTLTLAVNATDPHGVHLVCLYDGANVPCSSGNDVILPVTPGAHTFFASTYDDVDNTRTFLRHFTGVAVPTTKPGTRAATTVKAHAAHKRIKRHKRMRLTATVRPTHAAGTVVFTRGKHTLCTAKVRHGKATCRTKKLGRGTFHVVARYLGTTAYKAAKARFTFRVR